MTRFLLTSAWVFCTLTSLWGQSLSGVVRDAETKAPIEYAHVFLVDLGIGVYADSAGAFQLAEELPEVVRFRVGAHGYATLIEQHEPSDSLIFLLHSKHMEFDEVTVSTTTGVLQNYSITNVESHTMEELESVPTDLGQALTQIPGVYNSSTGTGISKPVIRGLSGMRVVTYLNELRIENQQWGGDHGMGVTELGLGRVEIIKGPSSLLYGADALGGVAYFIDEDYAPANSLQSYARSRFESNAMRTDNAAAFKLSKKNVRLNLFGRYVNSADFQLPDGRYALDSRFNGQQVKAAFGVNRKSWVMNVRYSYISGRVGIPGHTHDSLASLESFVTEEQSRGRSIPAQLTGTSLLLVENKFFFKRSELKVSLGNTFNRLREYEEKWTIPAIDMGLMVNSYNLRYRLGINEHMDLIIGAQGMHQLNANEDGVEEILIPDATTFDNGVYTLFTANWRKWNFQAGVRYDNRMIDSRTTGEFATPYSRVFQSVNYSAGFSKAWEHMGLRVNASSGFRAPHISELLADGVHHGSLRYEIGERSLNNEQAHQLDVAYELNTDHLSFIINPFYSRIFDYIALSPMDSVAQGLPVFKYEQLSYAELMGGDVGIHYHPHFAHRFHLEASYSCIYSQDDNGEALPMMPPGRISSVLKFQFDAKPKFRVEDIVLQYQYYFAQNRTAGMEANSQDYHLLNIGANFRWELPTPLTFQLGVKNALNQSYIDHLSRLKNIGMPAPGYNIYFGVKWQLDHKFKNRKS